MLDPRTGRLSSQGNNIPKVTYIEHNGTPHTVDVPVGTSVIRGAVDRHRRGLWRRVRLRHLPCRCRCSLATEDRAAGSRIAESRHAQLCRSPTRVCLARSRCARTWTDSWFACRKDSIGAILWSTGMSALVDAHVPVMSPHPCPQGRIAATRSAAEHGHRPVQ